MSGPPPVLPPLPNRNAPPPPAPAAPAPAPAAEPAKKAGTKSEGKAGAPPSSAAPAPVGPAPSPAPPEPIVGPAPGGPLPTPEAVPDSGRIEPPGPAVTLPARADGGARPRPAVAGPLAEDERPSRWPPPERPPFSGLTLFIASGATFVTAIIEQVFAQKALRQGCVEPVENAALNTTEDLSAIVTTCFGAAAAMLPLRVQSDLNLAATIGMVSAGSFLRARQHAYRDAMAGKPPRATRAFHGSGGALFGVGFFTWLASSSVTWARLGSCSDGDCILKLRATAAITRDVSVALMTAGAGLLVYALAYRNHHGRYARDRQISIGPALGTAGVVFGGRF